MPTSFVAVVLLIPAVYYDLVERRIPNALIGLGLIVGLAAVFSEAGWQAIPEHLLAAFLAFSISLPFWFLGWMGAGDVKFVMVLGLPLGLGSVFVFLANTALCGLLLALACLALKGMLGGFFRRLGVSMNLSLGLNRLVYVEPDSGQPQATLPYALAIAGGVVLTLSGVSPVL
ncbi:MAG: prepilin peptidase [Alcanivorax sp.]|nr:prepilin peptidase [Alcanivorax sp.]